MTRFRNVSKLLCFGGIYKVKRSQSGKTYVLTWKKIGFIFYLLHGSKRDRWSDRQCRPCTKKNICSYKSFVLRAGSIEKGSKTEMKMVVSLPIELRPRLLTRRPGE